MNEDNLVFTPKIPYSEDMLLNRSEETLPTPGKVELPSDWNNTWLKKKQSE